MRKILGVLVLAVLFVSLAFADGNPTAITEYSYEILNNSGTDALTRIIPTTSIRPGIDKIVAFEVTALPGLPGAECWAALFDDTTIAATGEKLGEKEAANGYTATERFPRPKMIANGVVSMQGVHTRLTIYFVRE